MTRMARRFCNSAAHWRCATLCAVGLSTALLVSVPTSAATASFAAGGRADGARAQAWLERMGQAFATETYDGVFTFLRGKQMSSLRVSHAVIDGVQHERLTHLDGTAREIIRVGGALTCVLMPGDELEGLTDSVPSGPLAGTFARDFSGVSEQYRLRMEGVGRVAGRNARQMSVKPMDSDRYGYALWLDETTGLLLKSEMLDQAGAPLEVFQFGQLRIGPALLASDFVPAAHARQVVINNAPTREKAARLPHSEGNGAAARTAWTADWLPAGFTMASSDVRRSPRRADTINTMMYSDGLAVLSVFVEALPKGTRSSAETRAMREGATIAMSLDVADKSGKPYLVTVVGEIPDGTAARVLHSVRRLP